MRMFVALCALCLTGVGCRFVSADPSREYPCASDADCAPLSLVCMDGTCRAPGGEDGGPEQPDACVPTQSCASLGLHCGTADDGCGNSLDCGSCPEGQGCGAAGQPGVCGMCQLTDVPDPRFIDSNCDGIDGQRDAGIFVDEAHGQDSNPGTLEQPLKSVQRALELAQTRGVPILVSAGTYDAGLEIAGVPAQVYGAYSPDAGWARADRYRTVILSPSTGARVRNVDGGVTLDHLELVSASASAVSQPASVGLRVSGVRTLSLSFVRVHAGRGVDGAGGPDGMPGAEGDPGSSPTAALMHVGGAGGSGCGGPGGAGGNAGFGSNKGDPGYEGGTATSNSGGGLGGPGGHGAVCTPFAPAGPGDTGMPGAPGDVGNPGVPGANAGTWNGELYVVANGELGGKGTAGQGGGGGGGGGGGQVPAGPVCTGTYGGGGGGGGGGGCPGSGGFGGFGGGASVALWVVRSQVELGQGVKLETEGGGAGGEGGAGGPGGDAGVGAPGTMVTGQSGSGGPGAPGGPGGGGGAGGGGGGGPSVGVWCLDGGVLSGADAGVFEIGPGGSGGTSPGRAGAAGLSVEQLGCP